LVDKVLIVCREAFGLGTEESRTFSLKTRTGLRKDESNCNGEEVRTDDVRRGEGKDGRTLLCALLLKKRCHRLFRYCQTLHGSTEQLAHRHGNFVPAGKLI
jgi:hypothetical protein